MRDKNKSLLKNIINTYKIDLKPFIEYFYEKKDICIVNNNYKELNLKKTLNIRLRKNSKQFISYIVNRKKYEYLYRINVDTMK